MSYEDNSTIQYFPCFFELPFKILCSGKLVERNWTCATIWMALGIVCAGGFTLGLHYWDATINWFTTLYFIGGLGWVPAVMCRLSHAYYDMFTEICHFLNESKESLKNYYEDSAGRTFGYLRKNSINTLISVIIWVFMVITVIVQNGTFRNEYAASSTFIYISFVFVGLIFTCVPCAVIQFLYSLNKLSKYSIKRNALYYGAAERLQRIHIYFTFLIWGIIILLFLLSIAMFNSPYHETLWIWLPVFGFLPSALFRRNKKATDLLIKSALMEEEKALQNQIDNILHSGLIPENGFILYALMGIRDKLCIYSKRKNIISNVLLLVFTILGGVGSIAAAILAFIK